MKIINNKTVLIYSFDELKSVLEEDNLYEKIYLGSDITLESGININDNKIKIIIDGTYEGVRYTLTGMNSGEKEDTICASINNNEITIRNINIIYTNPYGVVYVPVDKNYSNVLTSYDNIKFNGTELSFNPYGTTKITDSTIIIEQTNETPSEEVCESNMVIIGGNTNIVSSSNNSSLFYFRNDANPSIVFLCKSKVTISTDSKEFMSGTIKLNFTILHDTVVNIITANGFGSNTIYGVNNVLIDERATLKFIESKHQRIPMWTIYGNFTMKEGSNLELINSYDNTPSDNYNLHFKGSNCKLILDNPKKVIIYTKNANVIYTNNPLSFTFKCTRINLWTNSTTLTSAGDINDLPEYSWYKNDDLLEIKGIINTTETTIESNNFTSEELNELPDLTNFVFQSKKQFSIGNIPMNIHPINNTSNVLSGHTESFSDVLISYKDTKEIVTADIYGYFEYILLDKIEDNTTIEITANVSSSFVYSTRKIQTPFKGELSILSIKEVFEFDLNPISYNPLILPKKDDLLIKIVDSREKPSNFKLYCYIDKPMTSQMGYILEDALVFKTFEDNVITLKTTPVLIYSNDNNTGSKLISLNYSKEKGPLLDLSNNALENGEEYFQQLHFVIEE